MPDPVDYCNPLSIWQALIQFLTGSTPSSSTTTPPSVPGGIVPPLLNEPDYLIRETAAGKFQLGKPDFEIFDRAILPSAPFTMIQEFVTYAEAQAFQATLPPMKLPGKLHLQFDRAGKGSALPGEHPDWTAAPDAAKTSERLKAVLNRIPLMNTLPDATTVKLLMARLPAGMMAHFNEIRRAVYVDLSQASQASKGVLGLAATYIHELTHASNFERRGFFSNELAKLLKPDEYVLNALNDEYVAFQNEAKGIGQFLSTVPIDVKHKFQNNIEKAIDPPSTLYLSTTTASVPVATLDKLARETIGPGYLSGAQDDYALSKANPEIVPSAEATAWVTSPEWTAIQTTRSLWVDAGMLL